MSCTSSATWEIVPAHDLHRPPYGLKGTGSWVKGVKMREALLYDRVEDSRVRCELCAHRCLIADGQARDLPGAREPERHALFSGLRAARRPGAWTPSRRSRSSTFTRARTALSIATAGCNFRCLFCQNADISQMPRDRASHPGPTRSPRRRSSRAAQRQHGRQHRLHLHRADHLFRVRLRHRRAGPRGRDRQRLGDQRLHDPRDARHGHQPCGAHADGRGQRGPEVVPRRTSTARNAAPGCSRCWIA